MDSKQKTRVTKKTKTRELAALGMLTALSVLVGMVATFRVGSGIKVSFKFIPIFLTGALFGPLYGGIVAGISDFLAYFINSGGAAFMPQITLVEILYGVLYGLFFNRLSGKIKINALSIALFSFFQILVLNIGVTSYLLKDFFGGYAAAVAARVPAAAIALVLHTVFMTFFWKYIDVFKSYAKGK